MSLLPIDSGQSDQGTKPAAESAEHDDSGTETRSGVFGLLKNPSSARGANRALVLGAAPAENIVAADCGSDLPMPPICEETEPASESAGNDDRDDDEGNRRTAQDLRGPPVEDPVAADGGLDLPLSSNPMGEGAKPASASTENDYGEHEAGIQSKNEAGTLDLSAASGENMVTADQISLPLPTDSRQSDEEAKPASASAEHDNCGTETRTDMLDAIPAPTEELVATDAFGIPISSLLPTDSGQSDEGARPASGSAETNEGDNDDEIPSNGIDQSAASGEDVVAAIDTMIKVAAKEAMDSKIAFLQTRAQFEQENPAFANRGLDMSTDSGQSGHGSTPASVEQDDGETAQLEEERRKEVRKKEAAGEVGAEE